MSGHTPGPWVYDDDTATIDNDLGVSVAGINVDLHNYEANACLIAAAPELYESVKAANVQRDPRHRVSMLVNDWLRIEAALAKAEGRQP